MADALRIAIAGLGTVGAGVIRLIETNSDMIAARAGRPIEIVAVSARERGKDRGVDLSPYAWVDDMQAMAQRQDVDVVVELVGGSDGPALTLARSAFDAGKGLVTANKAMVAHHGLELAEAAAIQSGWGGECFKRQPAEFLLAVLHLGHPFRQIGDALAAAGVELFQHGHDLGPDPIAGKSHGLIAGVLPDRDGQVLADPGCFAAAEPQQRTP